MIPHTLVLKPGLIIHSIYRGNHPVTHAARVSTEGAPRSADMPTEAAMRDAVLLTGGRALDHLRANGPIFGKYRKRGEK